MDESGTSETRVTVDEAARLLGIERQSVKKRIQRRKLRSEKDASGEVYVWLDLSETVRDGSTDKSGTGRDELVEALRDQVADLRARLDREQEANREHRRLLAGLIERVPELEAPQERAESPETGGEGPEGAEPQSGAEGRQVGPERPWWRRMFGG